MDSEDLDDTATSVRLRSRSAFLLARDWVDGHQRLISASLYATAAVSLWVFKRSIRDHRINRIRRVVDIPPALVARQAKLRGVLVSADFCTGGLWLYHVPLLHRVFRIFHPLPLFVPRPPSGGGSFSSEDTGRAEKSEVLARGRDLLLMRLHEVSIPLNRDPWHFRAARLGKEEKSVTILRNFLTTHVFGRLVDVTVVSREGQHCGNQRNSPARTKTDEVLKYGRQNEGGRQSNEDTVVGARGCLAKGTQTSPHSTLATGNQLKECLSLPGHRDGGTPRQGDEEAKHSSASPCVFVNVRYWDGRLFSLKSHDLAEELLSRGLAVVAVGRLQTESDSCSRQPGWFGVSFWRRQRLLQRRKKLEDLEAQARDAGVGIWSIRPEDGPGN
ncbi:hypothetical protein CSUI_005191 [Cystoisospora suis]|uniref:Uncharacterized protein n=1 Tax=Cystoisospora suis TaxID=483139 RepID=A0A2C6KKE0_9APIC|nr:hypothetical protein CSUI_005191 [Cystoisospora suis]